MRDATSQLANSFHFLSHCKLFACLNQFLLRVPSLGCVPQYVCKTENISRVVVDGRDQARHKEWRAIVPYAPAHDFVFAPVAGLLQSAVRLTCTAFIGPKKYSKMLSDNLLGGVPHDLLC